jgi:hypothetical protein
MTRCPADSPCRHGRLPRDDPHRQPVVPRRPRACCLPRVRDPSLALYAFCRLADDEVDEGRDKVAAVLRLRDRLDRIYAGPPAATAAADRAFAAVVERL